MARKDLYALLVVTVTLVSHVLEASVSNQGKMAKVVDLVLNVLKA